MRRVVERVERSRQAVLWRAQLTTFLVGMDGHVHVVTAETHIRIKTLPLGDLRGTIKEIAQGLVVIELVTTFKPGRLATLLPLMLGIGFGQNTAPASGRRGVPLSSWAIQPANSRACASSSSSKA